MTSVAARLALPAGPPVIHTEHNVWARYRRPTRWANAWTYRRNAAVLAVSEAVAGSIGSRQRQGGIRLEVVRQGIDPGGVRSGVEARRRARSLLGIADDTAVVGTVGNLTAKKDHVTLLRAAAELRRGRPDLRLVLIGSGPLERDLRRAVDQLELQGCVSMLGSRADVADLLAGFDVFALSSRHEGLPIALLEAMAAGVGCVATRVGGVPEVVTDGVDGLLVEPGEPAALATAIARLLDDAELRAELGARARRTAGGFDLGAAVARTQAVYDEVLCLR
jgi:glycosyltransferase involved in cell wall biosynthesis